MISDYLSTIIWQALERGEEEQSEGTGLKRYTRVQTRSKYQQTWYNKAT